jgi:L-arabinose isomerase
MTINDILARLKTFCLLSKQNLLLPDHHVIVGHWQDDQFSETPLAWLVLSDGNHEEISELVPMLFGSYVSMACECEDRVSHALARLKDVA